MNEIPEYLQRVISGKSPPPPITNLIGFSLTQIEYGRAIIELEVNDRHTNPFGTVHGGIICDIADAAMGAACHSTLANDEICSTLEIKISFLQRAPKERLRAEGRVLKEGHNISFLECDITDSSGNLIARATGTLMKSKQKPPKSPRR